MLQTQAHAHLWSKESLGRLHVEVVSGAGEIASGSPVYLFQHGTTVPIAVYGGDTVSLPEGEYEIVAARVQRVRDGFLREISPMGHVQIIEGDQASVVLPLAELPPFSIQPIALSSRLADLLR